MTPDEVERVKQLLSRVTPYDQRPQEERDLISRVLAFKVEQDREAGAERQRKFLDWQTPPSDDPDFASAFDLVNAGADIKCG